jgi:hypothetical protein
MMLYITGLTCVGNFSLTKQILWKTNVSSELLKCAITNYVSICLHTSYNTLTEILENTQKRKYVSYIHLNIMAELPIPPSLYFQFHLLRTHIQHYPSEANPLCSLPFCMKWALVFIDLIGL